MQCGAACVALFCIVLYYYELYCVVGRGGCTMVVCRLASGARAWYGLFVAVCCCLTSAVDWFVEGSVLHYRVHVIMHVKDPKLSVKLLAYCVPLAGLD